MRNKRTVLWELGKTLNFGTVGVPKEGKTGQLPLIRIFSSVCFEINYRGFIT